MNYNRFSYLCTSQNLFRYSLITALTLALAACGGTGDDSPSAHPTAKPTATPTPITTSYLFVANGSGPNVLTFNFNDTGDIAPVATLSSASFSDPEGIAIDTLGSIIVGDEGVSSILYFPYADSGVRDIAPTSTITGQKAGALTLDGLGDLFVVDEAATETGGGQVAEFKQGSTTPSCTISYANFVDPEGIALDTSDGDLWVSDVGASGVAAPAVFEFSLQSGCPTAPIATLTGPTSTMQYPYAISFDSSGNLWVADAGSYAATIGPDQVLEFSASSLTTGSFDVAPAATISGATTQLNGPEGIAIGPNGEIIVTNDGADAATSSITTFASTATGNAAPLRVIAGSTTGLNEPEQVIYFAPSPTP